MKQNIDTVSYISLVEALSQITALLKLKTSVSQPDEEFVSDATNCYNATNFFREPNNFSDNNSSSATSEPRQNISCFVEEEKSPSPGPDFHSSELETGDIAREDHDESESPTENRPKAGEGGGSDFFIGQLYKDVDHCPNFMKHHQIKTECFDQEEDWERNSSPFAVHRPQEAENLNLDAKNVENDAIETSRKQKEQMVETDLGDGVIPDTAPLPDIIVKNEFLTSVRAESPPPGLFSNPSSEFLLSQQSTSIRNKNTNFVNSNKRRRTLSKSSPRLPGSNSNSLIKSIISKKVVRNTTHRQKIIRQ